jgi:SAM-dependent methyltransferase
MENKAWQLGAPGSAVYRFFDTLRKRLNAKLVNYLLSRGTRGERICVLEAGSGPAFASSILRADSRVRLSIAVDIDMQALEEARLRDNRLSLVCADLNHLPFKDGSVDLCWNSSTIEHLPDPNSALFEMQRVTSAGGRVFVGVPNVYGPLGFQRLIRDTPVGIWIGETFGKSELNRMCVGAGLNPLDNIFYFFRFFVGVLAQK